MIDRTRFLRLFAVASIALSAMLILSVSLPTLAADHRPELVSDPALLVETCGRPAARSEAFAEQCGLWARVGGLEVWYYENGYTESPPPAAPSRAQGDANRPLTISSLSSLSSLPSTTLTSTAYLPLAAKNYPSDEFRGVWVSRFDWTGFGITPTAATIDAIVTNVRTANFNAILFQVRGTADAYYTPGLEPWAARMTGQLTRTLGVDPGWDPLAYLVAQAHAQDIQVHAYVNVFPTWLCSLGAPPDPVTPTHLFWSLSHAATWDDWRAWTTSGPDSIASCGDYLWATPALSLTRAHVAAVAADLAARYDIDGVHLDLVRYPGSSYSHDPFTRQAYTDALAISPTLAFAQWQPGFQRARVDDLVSRVYSAVTAVKPEAWVSAAVWPNYTSGYNSYFQDSKGWLVAGIIDANMPMLYSSDIVTDLAAWTARMQGFVADSYGRYVIPGIHADYANFDDIAARIDAARAAGAPGVTIFSYGALNARGYFDDLGAGPFGSPAEVPRPNWKP